jgi:HNH endonuclease
MEMDSSLNVSQKRRSGSQICEICGTNRTLDRHHVVSRGMGGSKSPDVHSDENLTTLCRQCHRNIHEGGWLLERSPGLLRVIDVSTGDVVMRRLNTPDFDCASFFVFLERLERSLTEAVSVIPYLDDEQLVEAFRASRAFGKRSWVLQAAILYEAQRRSIYGDRSMEAIARRFEISLRQAEKYALVWRLFFVCEDAGEGDGQTAKNVNVDVFSLDEPSWYVVAASESAEPKRWLAYAQDKKAEDPRYSIRDFRSDIQEAIGAASVELEDNTVLVAASSTRVSWDCPWVKPYCTRSGRPVPARECVCDDPS